MDANVCQECRAHAIRFNIATGLLFKFVFPFYTFPRSSRHLFIKSVVIVSVSFYCGRLRMNISSLPHLQACPPTINPYCARLRTLWWTPSTKVATALGQVPLWPKPSLILSTRSHNNFLDRWVSCLFCRS